MTKTIVYGNRRQQIVSALTQWDVRQEKRDRYHNPHFLGIALGAFDDVTDAEIEADPRAFVLAHFNGRLVTFRSLAEND